MFYIQFYQGDGVSLFESLEKRGEEISEAMHQFYSNLHVRKEFTAEATLNEVVKVDYINGSSRLKNDKNSNDNDDNNNNNNKDKNIIKIVPIIIIIIVNIIKIVIVMMIIIIIMMMMIIIIIMIIIITAIIKIVIIIVMIMILTKTIRYCARRLYI